MLVALLAFTAGGLAWLDTAAAGVTVGECHDANSLHEHDEADEHCVHAAARSPSSAHHAAKPAPDHDPVADLPPALLFAAASRSPAALPAHRTCLNARPLEPPQLRVLKVTRLLI
jgi:hypothetical protein